MIYFDRPTKQAVIENLLKQLKPDGLLISGKSESLNGVSPELAKLGSSIYRKVLPYETAC